MTNLMFAGNKKVFDGMIITLLSFMKNTISRVIAYCLTMELRDIDDKYIPIYDQQAKLLRSILAQNAICRSRCTKQGKQTSKTPAYYF